MADVIKYSHPLDQTLLEADFQDLVPSTDTTLRDIAAGSTITAVASDGTDADAILFGKTRTTLVLAATLKNMVEGEEYTVTFLGQGTTSGQRFTRTYKVLCRKSLTGEF